MTTDLTAVEAAYRAYLADEELPPVPVVAFVPSLVSEIEELRAARARDAAQIQSQALSLSALSKQVTS